MQFPNSYDEAFCRINAVPNSYDEALCRINAVPNSYDEALCRTNAVLASLARLHGSILSERDERIDAGGAASGNYACGRGDKHQERGNGGKRGDVMYGNANDKARERAAEGEPDQQAGACADESDHQAFAGNETQH